jgi:hypothetical protein
MRPVSNEPDELLDQILEDERATGVREFYEREDSTIDATEPADM